MNARSATCVDAAVRVAQVVKAVVPRVHRPVMQARMMTAAVQVAVARAPKLVPARMLVLLRMTTTAAVVVVVQRVATPIAAAVVAAKPALLATELG